MKTGIAVFAYNRDMHLAKTLSGLKTNNEVKDIYIFQDGLKVEDHRKGWENTRKIIEGIDWCKVKFFPADRNKGLSRSIREGIACVLQDNDAVVVIEDDCVPTSNFIAYMLQCFEKYKDYKQVYAVNGYSRPIELFGNIFDVYFMPYFFSWGWGTWKDRWEQFEIDNGILDRIRNDREKSLYLSMWGGDYSETVFRAKLAGKNDSWAVYWTLKIFEAKGVCVTPYVSFIDNIGCDGTGVHCGKTDEFQTVLEHTGKRKYVLPEDIVLSEKVSKSMVDMYGGYTGINSDDQKAHIIVYGEGYFFHKNEKYINEHYYIVAIVDMGKEGYYAGKKIIKPAEVCLYQYSKIIIMLKDIDECCKVKKVLESEWNIPEEKICFGVEMLGQEN